MQGKNELHLCEAELVVAVQEYLHKRWGYYTPKVVAVGYNSHTYKVLLEGLWSDTEAAKPAAGGLLYACPVCGITGVSGVICNNLRCPTGITATAK